MSGKFSALIIGAVTSAALAAGLSSCKLDSLLYNTKKLTSYSLSSAVIPDSMRTMVTLNARGNAVYGFFVKSRKGVLNRAILYCHGNKESIEQYWDRVELLYEAGYAVFIFDYEGFGMSGGESSEEAMYADGRAALEYLRSRPDVNPDDIVYYGYSLGCVVAIDLSANVTKPRALILESPFASGSALVQSGTLLDVPGSTVLKGNYDNAAVIRRSRAPLLLFHGTDDRFIDLATNGQVVYDNANDPKKFIKVAGAGHTTIPWTMGTAAYLAEVEAFIAEH